MFTSRRSPTLDDREKGHFNVGASIFDKELGKKVSPEPYNKFITIYEFFEVLYKLFDKLEHLNKDNTEMNKITLREDYPDEELLESSPVVIYNMGQRRFFNHKTDNSFGNYQQSRPTELETNYDLVTNNQVTTYANKFITTINLEVLAGSNRDLERIVQFVEAVMLKHRAQLKCFVSDYIYVGQTPTTLNQAYQNKRLFTRGLVYEVITYETYDMVVEEIKYFK